MKKLIIAALALPLFTILSCKKNEDAGPRRFDAAAVSIGDGKAHTWMETDAQQHPTALGIHFDKDALGMLPTDDGHEYMLQLPAGAAGLPFHHVGINWNPHGHPPEHVYDLPHFDLHFYMIDEHTQMAIPAYAQDSTGFLDFPAAAYLPEHYVPIPGGEAMMGTHWVDVTSPELSQTAPERFTQTFIYGSFAGRVIFYEPMITLDFLKRAQAFTRSIPQPAKVDTDGYYPTQMRITPGGDGSVDVVLEGFVERGKG